LLSKLPRGLQEARLGGQNCPYVFFFKIPMIILYIFPK